MPNMIPIQGPLVSQPPVQVPTGLVQEEEIEDERSIKNKPTLTNLCPHSPEKNFLFFVFLLYSTNQILHCTSDFAKDRFGERPKNNQLVISSNPFIN
jgi:hypothetical protein